MSIFHRHHHDQQQHDAPAPGFNGGGAPPHAGEHTVRIYCGADESYSLSVRNGEVVLAPTNPRDAFQHWFKDTRHGSQVKDEEGFPSFALVNKATGQAIKHSLGPSHPVRLVPYNPEYVDESVLWTESNDTGAGFRCIRMVNNIRLNFDALHGDEDHGGVHDGTTVVLYEWFKGKNQRWKIVPWEASPNNAGWEAGATTRASTVRIFTKADENYSLSVRNGEIVLAPANPRDEYQHWYKDMKFSNSVKDDEGLPGFALVNKATGQAIKHSLGKSHPVRLVAYNPNFVDESVLWSESKDTGEGFKCIRMVNNIQLNFDALHGDKEHGGVRDGTTVVLWEWTKGPNQRWKIVPY